MYMNIILIHIKRGLKHVVAFLKLFYYIIFKN